MEAPNAVMTASLTCSFGAAPSALVVVPKGAPVQAEGMLAATVQDHVPMANVQPFGMCSSLANPTVAAATSAALGVLTPMPCVPATPAPWVPGAVTTLANGSPCLTLGSTLTCLWGGVIQIVKPGTTRTLSG